MSNEKSTQIVSALGGNAGGENDAAAYPGSGSELSPSYELFDNSATETEQLPRKLTLTFVESLSNDRGAAPVSVVRIYRGDKTLGDPLDDNSPNSDDYRFHDVLHLAHMAILGWSPTLRALLGVKRRSDPDVNRIQDGGRAAVVEEGLAAYVFSVAKECELFAGMERIPSDVIAACQSMTTHLEVAQRTASDWEAAILAGYEAFRQLVHYRGGTVSADLMTRTLVFNPPVAAPTKLQPKYTLKRGSVIVFEGLDRAGKSSQRELLEAAVDPASTTFAHMPSGFSDFTSRLYRLLENKPPSQPLARQLAHLACHSEALPNLVGASERGAVVLDRWWWSTMAYGWFASGGQLGLSEATFRALIEEIWDQFDADIIFLFLHAFESDDNNVDGVASGYEELAAAHRESNVVVVPSRNKSETHDFVIAELLRRGIAIRLG